MTYAKDATPPYYHGTRADLSIGDLLSPGFGSNYQEQALSWIYFSAAIDAAIWGAELAKGREGEGADGAGTARQRIYIVEPTGPFEDDPNLTDKKFPGNPTKSYRSQSPLKIIGEVDSWESHSAEALQAMKDGLAKLTAEGRNIIID